ncbi:hypothetical protein [Bacillus spongiae]|uniref:hypothetical protein n=1 Tax=Bacillus spongiae TaxID=2683610 RepID=UPI003014F3F6
MKLNNGMGGADEGYMGMKGRARCWTFEKAYKKAFIQCMKGSEGSTICRNPRFSFFKS